MNNLDDTQTIGGEVAANDGSLTINVDSSTSMIPPAGAENLNEDNDIWNWAREVRLEEFHPEDLNFPTVQKPPEFWNKAYQLPPGFGHPATSNSPWSQFVKSNVAKFNTLPTELRSLIMWQAENVGFKGKAAMEMGALGQAPGNDIAIINPLVAGGVTAGNNRKRKGIEVDDNYENNARFPRRGGLRTSQAVEYHTLPGRKSNYSINDKLMALHELVPGSQKADMATTLGETVEYLAQVKIREQLLLEEVKQLRQAIELMTGMHPTVQKFIHGPVGTPLNMGVTTQLGGMEFRPTVSPTWNMFNSSMSSARMKRPSFVPSLLQQNSVPSYGAGTANVAAAPRLFVPPQLPSPSQQPRTVQDKIDDTQGDMTTEIVAQNNLLARMFCTN